MPTPAERQALLFLAGVIVLGAGVRVVRAARGNGGDDAATRRALARQLAEVDSARAGIAEERAARSTGKGKGKRPASRPATRRDTASTRLPPTLGGINTRITTATEPSAPIDLDVANAAAIEALPRIGPALARRIVEDREQRGAFGSLEQLERVRGVGPALAASLRERVTFSGTARPSDAVVDNRLRSPPPRSKSSRRERRPRLTSP
jgi:competence protein ComEA